MPKRKSIIRQIQERLTGMAAFGQSKHADKAANGGYPARDKIYSRSTMDGYLDAAARFGAWARSEHGCRTLEDARAWTGEYLDHRQAEGLSAWTVRRDAAAIAKVYGCRTTELGSELPIRRRSEVTQHRGDRSVGHFDPERHADLVDLCRATGLRRHEVAALTTDDVYRDAEGRCMVHVAQGKGGKERTVVALSDAPLRVAAAARAAGSNRVIDHIPKYAPIHAYRREFAQELYDRSVAAAKGAQGGSDGSRTYVCRGDKAGTVYDRDAMLVVSQALGHNRLSVVTAYLR